MLTQGDNREILALIQERDRRLSQRSKYALFPEEDSEWTGPKTAVFNRGEKIYARDKYQKAMEFFAATSRYREVNVMAANRVGKTVMGGYAIACWATGEYPPWWEGRRFKGPIEIWVSGQTNETTRDILQRKLFGNVTMIDGKKGLDGTGVVPGEMICNPPSWKAGVTDLIDTMCVRHIDGGVSRIGIKSYQQGRISFEGLEKSILWLDEEPPPDIYDECLIRTMTVPGAVVLSTFTPLLGLSETALKFMPGNEE